MLPTAFSVTQRHPSTASVAVEGGKGTNPLWTSKISNEDFAQALRESLEKSQVFSRVVQADGADYQLNVHLLELDQPVIGFNMTVKMDTRWRLTRRSDSQVVFDERVHKEFTAGMGDAFAGVKRLRLANEGVARETITEGIRLLSELKLQ